MVLDANTEGLPLMEAVLRAEGLGVIVASNGSDALALADEVPPRALVLAPALPGDNPDIIVNQLRQMCGPRLPVVLVSAAEKLAEQARNIGALSFLEKPFDSEHLLLAVLRGLRARA
jgi:DNA-binding response OmpR family regulator